MFLSTEGELYCIYFFVLIMKVVKSQVILFMHERLILDKEINPDDVKKVFDSPILLSSANDILVS